MAFVQTTDGAHVDGKLPGKPDAYTMDEAQASAKERNVRAEDLGIKARYEAVEVEA